MSPVNRQTGSYILSFAVAMGFFLLSLFLAHWIGANGMRIPFIAPEGATKFESSDEKIRFLENRIRELESELAFVKRSTKVELSAVKEMKKTLQEKDLELLALNQELHFYNTLYMENSDNTRIQVKEFDLRGNLGTRKYTYELVLTGVANKSKEKVAGVIGLSVDGEQQNVLKRLVFEDASERNDLSLRFSFKYFQKISGSFSLPDDFEPSEVHIEVHRDGSDHQLIEVSYNWDDVYAGS